MKHKNQRIEGNTQKFRQTVNAVEEIVTMSNE